MNPEISEAFRRSISRGVRDEVHYSDNCDALKVMSQLNDHGKIVYSFLRKCECKKQKLLPDKQKIIDENSIVDLPQDGVDVHFNKNCEYEFIQFFDDKEACMAWEFKVHCKCGPKKLPSNRRNVDDFDRVRYH